MMDIREKQFLKMNMLSNLKLLGLVVLGFELIFTGVPSLTSLIFSGTLGDFSGLVPSMLTILLLFSFSLMLSNFDSGFKFAIQNGFSRQQIFKMNWMIVALITVLNTGARIILNFRGFNNSNYAGFFSNPILNLVALILLSLLGCYFIIQMGELFAAFLNLFSKKIRIWIAVLSFVVIMFILVSGLSITLFSIGGLVAGHVIDSKTVEVFIQGTAALLFGYNPHGAFNPMNMIITGMVVDGLITWLTRITTVHLQLHRN